MGLCSISDESQKDKVAGIIMHDTNILHEFINKCVLSKRSDVNRA